MVTARELIAMLKHGIGYKEIAHRTGLTRKQVKRKVDAYMKKQPDPVPEMSTQDLYMEIRDQLRGEFWPDDKPFPTSYMRFRVPCPKCRRIALKDGGQAVLVKYTRNGFAYFRCKACGFDEWKLRIEAR